MYININQKAATNANNARSSKAQLNQESMKPSRYQMICFCCGEFDHPYDEVQKLRQ